jgi:hypothetical protein
MPEDEIHVHTLDNKVKIFITKELKEELITKKIYVAKKLEMNKFFNYRVKVIDIDENRIVLGPLPPDDLWCTPGIDIWGQIPGVLIKGDSFEHPMVFLYLEQLITELKKIDKIKQKKYANMMRDILHDMFLRKE